MRIQTNAPEPRCGSLPLLALVFLATSLVHPAPAAGQAPAAGASRHSNSLCPDEARPERLEIPLNSTGIADFSLINPRDPRWLVGPEPQRSSLSRKAYRACLEDVSIRFANKTATRSFLVTLPFKLRTTSRLLADLDGGLREALLVVDSSALAGRQRVAAVLQQRIEELAAGTACRARKDPLTPDSIPALRCALRDLERTTIPTIAGLGPKGSLVARQAASLGRLVAAASRELTTLASLPDREKQCGEAGADGRITCSFQISVPVGGPDPALSPWQWEAVYASNPNQIRFVVSFFDNQATPTNATGYLRTRPKVPEEDSKTSWSLVGSLSYSHDPHVGRVDADGSRLRYTPADAYAGGQRERFPASGRLSLNQTLGNRAAASLDLTFKSGDLGGEASTSQLSATKYDVTLFGVRGFTTRAGRYTMAAPSDGLAVNESGEGVELVLPGLGGVSLGHIVKRESRTGRADAEDRDSQVTIFQARSLPVPEKLGITGANAILLYGKEDREDRDPYDYVTAGGELQFGSARRATALGLGKTKPEDASRIATNGPERWRTSTFSGSLAHYRSERDAETGEDSIVPTPGNPCSAETPCRVEDGEGHVTLLTLAWGRTLIGEKMAGGQPFYETRPLRSFQLRLGAGSGDDPSTPEDEGYLGETARFAPDKIFLASFAGDLDPMEGAPVGVGLGNKRYLELTYTDQTWSLLQRFSWWATRADRKRILANRKKDPFKNKDDPIVSQATIVKAHVYRFDEAVLGERDGGFELGVDFQVEVPKGIKSTLGIGRFFPGDALEPFFDDDPYIVTFSTSLTLQ